MYMAENSESLETNSSLEKNTDDMSRKAWAKTAIAISSGLIGFTAAYLGAGMYTFESGSIGEWNGTEYVVIDSFSWRRHVEQALIVGSAVSFVTIGFGAAYLGDEKDRKKKKMEEILGEEDYKKIEDLV